MDKTLLKQLKELNFVGRLGVRGYDGRQRLHGLLEQAALLAGQLGTFGSGPPRKKTNRRQVIGGVTFK